MGEPVRSTEAKAPAKKTTEKSADSAKKTTEPAIPDEFKHMYNTEPDEFKPSKAPVSKRKPRVTKPKSVEPKYTEDFEPEKVSGVVDMLPMVGVGAIVLVLLLLVCCCCRKKPEEDPLSTCGDTTGAQPSEPTPYQTRYGNGSTQQSTTGYTGYGTTKKKSDYGNTTPNYL